MQAGALGPRTRWRSALPRSALRDVCHPGRTSRHGDRHTPAGSVLGCLLPGTPRQNSSHARTRPTQGACPSQAVGALSPGGGPPGEQRSGGLATGKGHLVGAWNAASAPQTGPSSFQGSVLRAPRQPRGGLHGGQRAAPPPPPPRPDWCHGWGSEGRGAPCVWGPATLSGSTASPDSSGNTCHPFSSRVGQRPCPHRAAVEWGTISEDSQ